MFERTIEPRMTRRNDHEKREKRFSRRKLINSTTVCQPVIETRGRRHKGPFAGLYFPHLSITPYRFFAFSQLSIKMISEIARNRFFRRRRIIFSRKSFERPPSWRRILFPGGIGEEEGRLKLTIPAETPSACPIHEERQGDEYKSKRLRSFLLSARLD